jgi:hypothetical protein
LFRGTRLLQPLHELPQRSWLFSQSWLNLSLLSSFTVRLQTFCLSSIQRQLIAHLTWVMVTFCNDFLQPSDRNTYLWLPCVSAGFPVCLSASFACYIHGFSVSGNRALAFFPFLSSSTAETVFFGFPFLRWFLDLISSWCLSFRFFSVSSDMLLANFFVFACQSCFRTLHYPVFTLPVLLPALFPPDISHEPCCIVLLPEEIGKYLFSTSRLIFSTLSFCKPTTKVVNSFTNPPTTHQRTSCRSIFFQVTPQPFFRLVAVLILLLFMFI